MHHVDQRLSALCEARGVGGILIRRRSNMAWATGGGDFHCDAASDLGVAALLWTPDGKFVLTSTIEAARLHDEEPLVDWGLRAHPWWEPDPEMQRALAAAREGRYLCDWPDDCLYECRTPLTPTEMERARLLGADAAQLVERVLHEDVKPGMTERHVAGAIAGWLRTRGIFPQVALVAAGERIAAYRHPIPTARAIDRTVLVVVCAQRHGLIVSLSRMVCFGAPIADLRRRHDAACAVDRALRAATAPGARWCDALAAGVAEYARQGFAEEWKLHHQGGPTGYEPRDFVATPAETRQVQADQLVAWNPSITGTKCEDTILIHADGNRERLTVGEHWPRRDGSPDILVR